MIHLSKSIFALPNVKQPEEQDKSYGVVDAVVSCLHVFFSTSSMRR